MDALLQTALGPSATAEAPALRLPGPGCQSKNLVDELDRYATADSALCADPAIDTAMVFADFDAGGGQHLTAVWCWAAGAVETVDDVLARLRVQLAHDQLPRSVITVDAMPHTPADHIDREAVHKIAAVARLVGCIRSGRPVRTP